MTSRTIKTDFHLAKLSPNREGLLVWLARYRYLDTKHIFLLAPYTNKNAYKALRLLWLAGLVERLPNNLYRRDNILDPQVYSITDKGEEYLASKGLLPAKATYFTGGGLPDHNLKLCLALACIEAAARNAGLTFHAWDDIVANMPRKLKTPHRFDIGNGHLTPDAIFAIEYPDQFRTFFFELDLSNHSRKDYEQKAESYKRLIYDGIYKQQFGMKQEASVLTVSSSTRRLTDTIIPLQNEKFFLHKAMPQYGDYHRAPEPALDILTGWQGTYPNLSNLGGTSGRSENQRVA